MKHCIRYNFVKIVLTLTMNPECCIIRDIMSCTAVIRLDRFFKQTKAVIHTVGERNRSSSLLLLLHSP